MTRATTIAAIVTALALALAGCGDDDATSTTNSRPDAATQAPQTTPPTVTGGLPPQFVRCMADRGYQISSPAEIHSAPPEALQACFQALHGNATP